MRSIQVWTLPVGCSNCIATKQFLKNFNIHYTEHDLTLPENEEALEKFKSSGYGSAPIVEVYYAEEGVPEFELEDIWSGYNEEKLQELR